MSSTERRRAGRSHHAHFPVIRALDAYLNGRTSGALFVTSTGKRVGLPEAWRIVRQLVEKSLGKALLQRHAANAVTAFLADN